MRSMNKSMRKYIIAITIACTFSAFAKENIEVEEPNTTRTNNSSIKMKFGSDCDPATQSADLDINNVRTKILNGGDMWWDLNAARYEIPKLVDVNAVRKNSLFSGAIWIGGQDQAENLRLAAMTYRQRGSDFWPGPLDPATGNTSKAQCDEWDKIYKVDGKNIIDHATNFTGVVNEQIENWPGEYAPFYDGDGDGIYNPQNGLDYPVLQNFCRGQKIDNEAEDQPDQMLWWIYNDKGNIHTETQGDPIGVEMQTTAFAFATNDEINDMTFYTTLITNRGATELNNTYFGQWVDADLGNYADDYVGCDVGLSLGFCYNGDDNDEGILGYGLNPPSVGVDFFEGPKVKQIGPTGLEEEVELGMSKFVYYNNDANQINGNPFIATDFYNYLQGKWRTGTDIQYGGNGITGTDGTKADWMFPFDSDTTHPDDNWNENTAGNQPADRRFIQSSGPFVLEPGAVQKLTVGVVWARAPFGGATGSLELLRLASSRAQELFNSCFDLVDGPDAPEVEVHEQDQQIVLSLGLTNTDRVERYRDTLLDGANREEYFGFQGYRVFQLKNGGVSLSELDDLSKAREIFQCDLKDDFDVLINQEFQFDVGAPIPVLKVRGDNQGLTHTVRITEDQFATGSNKTLVNFQTYHFIVLSYAAAESNTRPYLPGRKIKKFSASPHKLEPKFGGSSVPSFYGDGPELQRISGKGNGMNELELKPEVIEEILKNNSVANPIYENGFGPVDIKVIDPLKIPLGEFELSLVPKGVTQNTGNDDDSLWADSTAWILTNLTTGESVSSDTSLAYENEQIILASTTGKSILDWGMAVTISQVAAPGVDPVRNLENGFIDWSVTFSDPSNEWLSAVRDNDVGNARQFGAFDWIRSGVNGRLEGFNDPSFHDYSSGGNALDPDAKFESIWEGRIAPNRLVSNTSEAVSPGRQQILVQPMTFGYQAMQGIGLDKLSSVDIVLTPDESKWSECVVLEMGEDPGLNQDQKEKFSMRTGTLSYRGNNLKPGKTIFPGYAINVNTGERLNIMVGEDSYQRSENGRDMKWNPTDRNDVFNGSYASFGGRHFIYVMGSHQGIASSIHPKLPIYDRGEEYYNMLSSMTTANRTSTLTKIFQNCDWVIPAMMAPGKSLVENEDGIPVPPNEVKIRLRVGMPYGVTPETSNENEGRPKYKFSTEDIYNDINDENGKKALDLANIVPNPYYAFSGYEGSAIDNRVKLTNLPEKCEISIYTLDGALVRRIKKDDITTELDWNLKNNANVPIASGLYIIHIDAGDLGEKILKWMGVMRELDLDSF